MKDTTMVKAGRRNSRIHVEVTIVLILFLAIAVSALADFGVIKLPGVLAMKANDGENVLFELFSVQASVATVGIAIISIITGATNEMILGISVSDYITNIKPKILKHKALIIGNLILIVLDYFFAAFLLYNLSVAAFFVSIVTISVLASDTYILFFGKDKLRNEIHEFALASYSTEYLDDLAKDMINSIDSGNSLAFNEDLALVEMIFEKEVKAGDFQSTEVTEKIEKLVATAFNKCAEKDDLERSLDVLSGICNLYHTANVGDDKGLPLDIWGSILHNFFGVLGGATYKQLSRDFIIFQMRNEIYTNVKKGKMNCGAADMRYYSSWAYSSCMRNIKLSEDEKQRLTKEIYENVEQCVLYEARGTEEGPTMMAEMCSLLKVMIDRGDAQSVCKLFFEHIRYWWDKTEYAAVFLVISIYLYYLSQREKEVPIPVLKKYAEDIIQQNQGAISYFYYDIDLADIIDKYYSFIKECLRGWEAMEEGKAKVAIMGDVVEDFLIYSALNKYWNRRNLAAVMDTIAVGGMFRFYDRYFRDGVMTKSGAFEDFRKKYLNESQERDLKEMLVVLKDIFDERYRDEIIREGVAHAITPEKIMAFTAKIQKVFEEFVAKELSAFKCVGETKEYQRRRIPLLSMTVPYGLFAEEKVDNMISSTICSATVYQFLGLIAQHLNMRAVKYEAKNKQETLITMVKSLNITPDTVVGNRETFWEEDDKNALNRFTEGMQRITFPDGNNVYAILDSSLIHFSFSAFEIRCEDLDITEVEKRCRKEADGSTCFNVTNDIYIPFGDEELTEHIHRTMKKVTIFALATYKADKRKVGAGIEITFD